MMSKLLERTSVALLLLSGGGCTSTLPRQPEPERILPVLATDPPPSVAGSGQIALDVTTGRAKVSRLLQESRGGATAWGPGGSASAYGWEETTAPVCTTPCVANLPYGVQTLKFAPEGEGLGVALVEATIGQSPTALRVTPGVYEPTGLGTILGGSMALGFGIAGLLVGGMFTALDVDGGTPILVGGAALTAGGAAWLALDPTVTQEAGSVQWQPADGRVYERR